MAFFNAYNATIAIVHGGQGERAAPAGISVADIDGDGDQDLVIGWQGDTAPDENGVLTGTALPVGVYLNDGEGNFSDGSALFTTDPTSSMIPNYSFVGDFNGDGVDDVYLSESGPEQYTFPGGQGVLILSNGSGGLIDGTPLLADLNAMSTADVAVGDVNGDGKDDFFRTPGGGGNHLQLNLSDSAGFIDATGQLPFTLWMGPDPEPGNPLGNPGGTALQLLDADGDTDLDLVIGRTTARPDVPCVILFNDGVGNFDFGASSALPFIVATDELTHDFIAVDFDRDGDMDMAASGIYGDQGFAGPIWMGLYINDGAGNFTTQSLAYNNAPGEQFLIDADVNNDGWIDIVSTSSHRRQFFINDGSGGFTTLPANSIIDDEEYIIRMSAADFNNDGRTDFIGDNGYAPSDAAIRLYLGQDHGLIQAGDAEDNAILGDADDESLSGLAGDDVIFGAQGADTLSGGDDDDYLNGGADADALAGDAGADTLNGGAGADDLLGGGGADIYIVDNALDVVHEDAAGGSDLVRSALSWTLSVNVEDLTLTGTAAINGTGNTLANTLTGNSGANILNGMSGADTMLGGGGNDTYVVDSAADVTTEASSSGGTDLVQSAVTRTLGANLENLTLTGAAVINGTGNTQANVIIGNGAANVLNGMAGADTMSGGNGNDTYVVDNAADVTTETSATGGADLVQSAVTRTLGANLENLALIGAAAINGAGNALANVITGNAAANILSGGGGGDTLNGGRGKDQLTGGAGADNFVFNVAATAANVDRVHDFTHNTDTIRLDNAVFTALGANAANLAATKFFAGANAHDANDRIIYNPANGQLFYDANGNATGQKVLIATLDAGLTITASDFQVI